MQKASHTQVANGSAISAQNRAIGLSPQTPETVDYRGYFKVETYPNNSVIYRPGDPATRSTCSAPGACA